MLPEDVISFATSGGVFNSNNLPVNPYSGDLSNLTTAFQNNQRVMVGFNTKSGAHAVMLRKIKIFPTGQYKLWFAETSPQRLAPYSTRSLVKDFIIPPRFWSFYR